MASLNQTQKTLIVTRLACFDTPTEVQAELREVQNVEASLSQIQYYDPTQPSSSKLARKWAALFAETRARFKREVEDIAIANKAYRLKRLDKLARTARSPKLEAELLEQAAKEVGDVYTNRRVHSGSLNIDWGSLSDDQVDRLAAGVEPDKVLAE